MSTEQQEQPKYSVQSRPTSEDYILIRDYVLLPHMMTMVQRSIEEIEYTPNVLKRLYTLSAQTVLDRISKDLYEAKRELKKRQIKVFDYDQSDTVLYCQFSCRGYQEKFGIMREVARSEISVRLAKYVKEIASRLNVAGL